MRHATVGNLALVHWAVYWIMNGLDKFLNRTDLLLFRWHGKDRLDQFSGYLTNTDISTFWVKPLLYFTGLIEFIVVVPLILLLRASLRDKAVS